MNVFILSRYVFELSVNAMMEVGSFSRMMILESANKCSEADLDVSSGCEIGIGHTMGTREA